MDITNLMQILYEDIYINSKSTVSYLTTNLDIFSAIRDITTTIAKRNSIYNEHPTDSLCLTLLEYPIEYNSIIQDKDLPATMTNSVIVSLIAICILINKGYSYTDAINNLYDNDFFTWFACYGRYAASEDCLDIIDTLKAYGVWQE